MSKIISQTKYIATVYEIKDGWVVFNVGNAYIRRDSVKNFTPRPKIKQRFLITNTLETLDDKKAEQQDGK